jgi:hypothetical protein
LGTPIGNARMADAMIADAFGVKSSNDADRFWHSPRGMKQKK